MTDMDVVFHGEEFATLPKILCHKSEDSEMTRRAAMTIDEILVANLGDAYVEPHLLVFPTPFSSNLSGPHRIERRYHLQTIPIHCSRSISDDPPIH